MVAKSLREQLAENFDALEDGVDPDPNPEIIEEAPVEPDEPEGDAIEAKEPEKQAEPVVEEEIPIPARWKAVEAHWKSAPKEILQEITKREKEIEKALTAHDGDLSMGRSMKEVITPYLPIIQAEGGTPEKAVQQLLNTAYQLRTAPPQRKAALLMDIARQYDIDLGAVQQQQQVHPQIRALQERIAQQDQQILEWQRQQQTAEEQKIAEEIQSFASNPDHPYFEQVRAEMHALLAGGRAKDLKEAYELSIWANPEIRSTLLAKQQAEAEEKRKVEIAAKKKAGSSVSGSPAAPADNSGRTKKQPLRNQLADEYDRLMGGAAV